MLKCLQKMWNDDRGAIVSIELILIVTIAVLSLVVGWSEVANAVNTELDDISNAVGHFNQSYYYSGFGSYKMWGGVKSYFQGSSFFDLPDDCDGNCSGFSTITCFGAGVCGESGFGGGYGGGGGGVAVGNFGYAPGTGGRAVVGPSIPCPSGDCVTDQPATCAVLAPQPDHGVPSYGPSVQPIGPQPALPTPAPGN